jgi:hypothetical protein
MEARSQSAAHPNEMNFIFNLNAFSWKAMQLSLGRARISCLFDLTLSSSTFHPLAERNAFRFTGCALYRLAAAVRRYCFTQLATVFALMLRLTHFAVLNQSTRRLSPRLELHNPQAMTTCFSCRRGQ